MPLRVITDGYTQPEHEWLDLGAYTNLGVEFLVLTAGTATEKMSIETAAVKDEGSFKTIPLVDVDLGTAGVFHVYTNQFMRVPRSVPRPRFARPRPAGAAGRWRSDLSTGGQDGSGSLAFGSIVQRQLDASEARQSHPKDRNPCVQTISPRVRRPQGPESVRSDHLSPIRRHRGHPPPARPRCHTPTTCHGLTPRRGRRSLADPCHTPTTCHGVTPG